MITFALVIYFGIFAVFASYMIFRSNISGFQKVILPALLFLSIIWTYIAIGHEKGFPTPVHVPDGDVVAIEIVNPSDTEPGGIFVWVFPQTDEESWKLGYFLGTDRSRRPKAYSIPYSDERAKKYAEIKEQMKNGYIVKNKTQTNMGREGNLGNRQQHDYDFEIVDPREANPKDS